MDSRQPINLLMVIGILAALVGLSFALNISALNGYWRWDDSAILLHLHRYSFINDFISPEIWRELQPSNLTPWLPLSYEVDFNLFGLDTRGFYAHQLISIGIAAFILYLLLSLWVAKSFSLFGGVLFLLGAPLAVVAQQLMTRHYIEGMIFAGLSLYFYVLSLRGKNAWYLAASLVLYVASMTAKEVYVPLVLLLIFVPESTFRARVIFAVPHLSIAALYVLWRSYMLPSVSGGYTDPSQYLTASNMSAIIQSFLNIPNLLFGRFWLIPTLLYFGLLIAYGIKLKTRFVVFVVTALLIMIPMVPLTLFPGIVIADRYLFLPWFGICFSIVYVGFHLKQANSQSGRFFNKNLLIMASFSIFAAFGFTAASKLSSSVSAVAREFDVQGQFIWSSSDDAAFIPSPHVLTSFWFVTALADFKHRLTEEPAPTAAVDNIYLDATFKELWQYDASCACMTQPEQSLPDRLDAFYSSLRADVPLNVDYAYQDGYFSWNFGPHEDGQYSFVSNSFGSLPVPRTGRLRVNVVDGTSFYLRYSSPAGWITYSDELSIEAGTSTSNWKRQ